MSFPTPQQSCSAVWRIEHPHLDAVVRPAADEDWFPEEHGKSSTQVNITTSQGTRKAAGWVIAPPADA